jgi:RecD/TraA family predicted helicase
LPEGQIVKFIGEIDRCVFSSNDFKIYGVNIDYNFNADVYEKLKFNKYGNISILGDLSDLDLGCLYNIEAVEQQAKNKDYGCQYLVKKIWRDKPTSESSTKKFLNEILTSKQTETLFNAYPNIIDMIMKNEPVDLNKTKGIKNKMFQKIRNKVINEFCLIDLINEYAEYGISLSVLKKLYDKYTSINKVREKIKNDPYTCLCELSGIQFIKADSIILKINPSMRIAKQRLESCILYLLEQNENDGNTKMDLKTLYSKCHELVPETMDMFLDVVENNSNIYLDKENKVIANNKAYICEKYIADILQNMINMQSPLFIDYKQYIKFNGVELTEQQQNALKNLCEYKVSLLAGYAGSGKSQTTKAIINMLDDNNFTYLLLAPTGKSAKVLSEYTDREASTIHRGLKYNPELGWVYNQNNKLDCDVVICDEASMVDIYLMEHLLDAIDINKTRLLFIQDPEQIPSVSAGNVSYDMLQSKIIPTTTLTHIFRYGEGGLMNVATKVRNGEKYIDSNFTGIQNYGINKDYSLISIPQESTLEYISKLYKKLINDGITIDDIMILSCYNKGDYGTVNINKIIQNIINPYNSNKHEIKYGEHVYREGDKVIQVVNNYTAVNDNYDPTDIFNGNMGIIKSIMNGEIFVDYGDKIIVYNSDELSQIKLSYSISIHKSQGSSARYVILITPKSHKFFLNKNLLYTGLTRAKERVFHICTPDVINSSLKKCINYDRQTFLQELLIS